MSNVFKTLTALNVNEKTEKKGKFTYLSWAWAWDRFAQHYPEATYEIAKNELNLPYFNSDAGAMVYTKVTAGGITHEMWLPIMDSRNQALKTFNMMDVNKTVMRCLVKNLAMFGLGLYIYAGEDLPEEADRNADDMSDDTAEMKEQLNELISKAKNTEESTQWVLKNYKVSSLEQLDSTQLKHVINLFQQKSKNENPKS